MSPLDLPPQLRPTANQFRPSGLACTACRKRYHDCSELEFDQMKVIKLDRDGLKVVKCREFVARPKP